MSGGYIIRVAGEGTASVSTTAPGQGPGSRRRARAATPLPTLYEELEPTYSASLGYEAEKTIRRDIAWTEENVGDAETGGWIFVAKNRPDYIIRATVPGHDSVASRSSINLGFEQCEAVQRMYPDLEIAGDWHFHPGPGSDDIPSDTDLRAFSRGARLSGGRWISLIASPSRTWRPEPQISGWITFGYGTEQLITERLALR
jgi:proteasome lid subunit RPN8/RPN11